MNNNNVQQIKDALSIDTVIGSYIQLERAGKNFKARCPFHNEKTPSFYVTLDRGTYKCFGCGKGGDIFSFVQEIEGIDFYGSLKLLAEKAGITLTREESQGNHTNILYDIMDTAQRWYEVQLRTTPAVVEYLVGRGLSKETITQFHIGYAPVGWTHLYEVLRARGYSDSDIRDTGLCLDGKQGGLYDRFRERIMFPIRDSQGRTIAFTGRIFQLPGSTVDISQVGKYVNSPEGKLYDKSRVLYGYDMAKRSLLSQGRVVIVEGQVDLIMAHQAGTTEAVALSGTALTPQHCELIKRFTQKVILALDGDEAGLKAAERSVMIAYHQELDVQVVILPDGKDPADIIAESPDTWKQLLASARDYIDVRLSLLQKNSSARVQDQFADIRQHIFPFIQHVHNTIFRDAYMSRIANTLGVSPESVRSEFVRFDSAHPLEATTPSLGARPLSTQQSPVKKQQVSYQESIVGSIEWLRSHNDDASNIRIYIDRYNQIVGTPDAYEIYKNSLGSLLEELIMRSSLNNGGDANEQHHKVLESMLDLFELETLQARHKELRAHIQVAGADVPHALVKELEALSKNIDALKAGMNRDELIGK